MPKKKSIWKRETPCLVCETTMFNYQFMAKSQSIQYDEWLVSHTEPIGSYEDYPDVLKTTICPNCLLASNEYSFGVDSYKYFNRSLTRNDQIKEFFENTINERFNVLAHMYGTLEKQSASLDVQNKLPANTRCRATLEKIWSAKDKYGVPFFTMMFQEPRDSVTALVCFAVDRYCQMVRIAYQNDIEPSNWNNDFLWNAIEAHFGENASDMKSPDPRFYFIGVNYLQCIQFLEQLKETLSIDEDGTIDGLINTYWDQAYAAMQYSFRNDDITAIPCELKDGGMNFLMAKLHFRFGNEEEGKKCLRFAKNYADNRLKRISNRNQQNFVNDVDDLFKLKFENADEKKQTG